MLNNFERSFEISHDPMAILDLDGNFKRVNMAFSRVLGWETIELVEKSFWDMVVFPDHQQIDLSRVIQNLSRGHPVFFVDGLFKCKSEEMYSLRWTAYPNHENENIGLVFRAPLQLGENQDLLKLAVEASPTAILIVSNTKIIFVNQLMETTFGYVKEELNEKPVELLVPTRLRTIHYSHLERYNQEPHLRLMGATLDLIGRRKDGTEFPVDIGLNPIKTANGLLVICSVIDLTRRRDAEDILAHRIQNLEQKVTMLDKLSKTDALTAIKNRRALDMQMELQYHNAQRNGDALSFVCAQKLSGK